MLRIAQADQSSFLCGAALRLGGIAALSCLCAVLAGCGGGGFSLAKAEVDKSLYTSSAPVAAKPYDADRLSDETTIRNAVTSADLETLSGQPLPWANAGTGARGQITAIAERKQAGALCRRFSATRENFDGILMFQGETCMVGSGAWRMQNFESL